MSRSTSAHLAFQLVSISADMRISAVSGSPFRKQFLSFPERGGEECHDGEDLQPSQEHACGKHEAAQGIDDLVALHSTYLAPAPDRRLSGLLPLRWQTREATAPPAGQRQTSPNRRPPSRLRRARGPRSVRPR